MFNLNLQACYSIHDIIFTVSLFVMTMAVILCFFYLITNLITGAILEVRDTKNKRGASINTQ